MQSRMKGWGLALLMTTALFAGPIQAQAQSTQTQTVLDLATGYPITSFHVQNLQLMADDVRQRTQGKLLIKVHAGGSLVKAPEIRKALAEGKVALGEVFGPSLSAVHPVFGLDAMPFLATTHDSAERLWRLAKPLATKEAAKQGWVLMLSVPWPPQNLFSSREIKSVSDFQGLAMRENSPAVRRMAEKLGAVPTTVETPELVAALKANKIQLVFTSAAQGVDTRMWETLPWLYQANAWLPRNVVLANAKQIEQLAPAHKEALMAAAAAAEERGWRLSRENSVQMLNALRAVGMKMGVLDQSSRARMDRVGAEFTAKAMEQADPELLSVLSAYLSGAR